MDRVQEELDVSERRACRVLGQARAVQRHTPEVRDDEEPLTGRIVELAAVYGRYGTPRITAMLREEGWMVNHKRVERIWGEEGLKVPQKQPKRGRLWLNDGSCVRLRPARKDHVWAYDFVCSRTHDGVSTTTGFDRIHRWGIARRPPRRLLLVRPPPRYGRTSRNRLGDRRAVTVQWSSYWPN